jgi:hypothetical protein
MPVVTLENCEHWWHVFVVHPNGQVELVSTEKENEAVYASESPSFLRNIRAARHGHSYHPAFLQGVAKVYSGVVDVVTLEAAAGRWVLNNIPVDQHEKQFSYT